MGAKIAVTGGLQAILLRCLQSAIAGALGHAPLVPGQPAAWFVVAAEVATGRIRRETTTSKPGRSPLRAGGGLCREASRSASLRA